MDDVINKYHALMKASQEMLEVSALAQNGVYLAESEVERRRLELEGATKAFGRACVRSGHAEDKERPSNGVAAQLALI